jgi:hypothetical protein
MPLKNGGFLREAVDVRTYICTSTCAVLQLVRSLKEEAQRKFEFARIRGRLCRLARSEMLFRQFVEDLRCLNLG